MSQQASASDFSDFHDKTWIVRGCHPVTTGRHSYHFVKSGYTFHTRVVNEKVDLEVRDPKGNVTETYSGLEPIAGGFCKEIEVEEARYYLEMRICDQTPNNKRMLYGALVRLGDLVGDEDASGGWTGEAQGGGENGDDHDGDGETA